MSLSPRGDMHTDAYAPPLGFPGAAHYVAGSGVLDPHDRPS
jgi:hypothetical protein